MYRVRAAVWSATTSDLRTSESRWRSTSTSSAPSSTAQTLVRSNPPANTEVDAEQLAFVVGQQVVRPGHRVGERELPGRARLRAPQQPEPIGESVADLDRAHRGHAGGGQLDSQREPVEGLADLGHRGGGVGLRQTRSRAGPARARSTNNVTASEVTPPSSASGGTVNTVSPSSIRFSRDVARTLTFRDRPSIAAIADRRGAEDVLAVVDHQQQLPTRQRVGDGVDQRRVRRAA